MRQSSAHTGSGICEWTKGLIGFDAFFFDRFYSGTIFRIPELLKYDYYWRLDSATVEFTCNVSFDPFVYMQERVCAT